MSDAARLRTTRRALLLLATLAVPPAAAGRARAQAGAGAPIIDAPSAAGIGGAGGVLVDIRTPAERRRAGAVPEGAVAIPLQDDELRFRASFAADVLAAAGADRARPVALIDADGRRAQYAARLLAAQGFAQALAVGEGLHGSNLGPGWIARGLPMRPCGGEC